MKGITRLTEIGKNIEEGYDECEEDHTDGGLIH